MSVELTWAGGEHTFALRIEHLRALQDRCDAGPAWVLARLGSGQWLVNDIIDTIRLGLEGGGMPKDDARKLVKKYVENEPLTLSVLTARAVLMSALYGNPDDPVGEAKGEDQGVVTPQTSPAENGSGAPSLEPEPS